MSQFIYVEHTNTNKIIIKKEIEEIYLDMEIIFPRIVHLFFNRDEINGGKCYLYTMRNTHMLFHRNWVLIEI
jgi:hypothetical protein